MVAGVAGAGAALCRGEAARHCDCAGVLCCGDHQSARVVGHGRDDHPGWADLWTVVAATVVDHSVCSTEDFEGTFVQLTFLQKSLQSVLYIRYSTVRVDYAHS